MPDLTVLLVAVIVIVTAPDPREAPMVEEHIFGPEADPEFFDELQAVFDKYPDTAQKYSIHCIAFEKDRMGVDFEKQIGISRVESNQIITEFQDRDVGGTIGGFECTDWDQFGHCTHGTLPPT
jgi:hypothetical protein